MQHLLFLNFCVSVGVNTDVQRRLFQSEHISAEMFVNAVMSYVHIPNACISFCRKWKAVEARSLRVSVGSFLEHLALVMETMDAFGPPAQ